MSTKLEALLMKLETVAAERKSRGEAFPPVAVVSMVGSLCPITIGHVQCYVEARKILLDTAPSAPRPSRLEQFSECIGLVSLNGDGHVMSKLAQKGEKGLCVQDRKHLVQLAAAEHPWLDYSRGYPGTLGELQQKCPSLHFVVFDMNGADDVIKYGKYRWASDHNRMITIMRPGSTEDLVAQLDAAGIDRDNANCIIGPELPDISATKARAASRDGDRAELLKLLPPAVADWMLHNDGHGGATADSADAASCSHATPPRPVLRLLHQRSDTAITTTMLRDRETSKQEGWLQPRNIVPNGEYVDARSTKHTDNGVFVWIYRDGQLGCLQAKHVRMMAMMRRPEGDPVRTTQLRAEPTTAQRCFIPGAIVYEDAMVELKHLENGFARIIDHSLGAEGWIQARYLQGDWDEPHPD